MKKDAVLCCAAIALILSAGAGFTAPLNAGGMHGHGHVAQPRQGFEHHRFERRHEPGRFDRFGRHSRVIIIGGPFLEPPIYYPPPLYTEQNPPIYIAPGVGYSYYCADPSGYYPAIQYCPSGWLLVVPEPLPD